MVKNFSDFFINLAKTDIIKKKAYPSFANYILGYFAFGYSYKLVFQPLCYPAARNLVKYPHIAVVTNIFG